MDLRPGRVPLAGHETRLETYETLPSAPLTAARVPLGEPSETIVGGRTSLRGAELTQARGLADGVTMLAGVRGYAPPAGTLLLDESAGPVRAHGSVVAILSPDPQLTIANRPRPAPGVMIASASNAECSPGGIRRALLARSRDPRGWTRDFPGRDGWRIAGTCRHQARPPRRPP